MAEIEKVRDEWRKFCAKRERPWNAWYPPDHIFEFAAAFAQQERDDERERQRIQMEASLATERHDCESALLALAGIGYPTPVKGYGTNTSWAISDLCRAIRARGEKGSGK